MPCVMSESRLRNETGEKKRIPVKWGREKCGGSEGHVETEGKLNVETLGFTNGGGWEVKRNAPGPTYFRALFLVVSFLPFLIHMRNACMFVFAYCLIIFSRCVYVHTSDSV